MTIHKSNYHGFSLVEMAVVIMLIGVLMTFGIKLARSFQDREAFSVTHNKQIILKEALISYLAQNGRLPCPASILSPPTGLENPLIPTGACDISPGIIPYATLGIPRDAAVDGWSRLFLYEVANSSIPACTGWVSVANFLGTAVRTYHDGEAGCINIVDGTTTPSTNRLLVAAIVSNGPNGEGGFTSKGTAMDLNEADTTLSNEKDNIPNHSGKVAHTFHTEPPTLVGFDDIVLEINANDLLAPLKREGSIVSINQIARDYFSSNILVDSSCNLIFPVDVSPSPGSGVTNQSPVLLTITYNGRPFTHTMAGADYGCPTGFNY